MASSESMSTRKRVLDAASRLLTEHGPGSLTTRRIAAEAGTTTMAIASRFGGKIGVIEALYLEGFDRLTRAMGEAPLPGHPDEDLRHLAALYRETALANEAHYQIMFERPFHEFQPSSEARRVAVDSFGVIVEAAARFHEAHGLPGDPLNTALELWAAVHGLVSLELNGVMNAEHGQMLHAQLIDAVLDGYRARREVGA